MDFLFLFLGDSLFVWILGNKVTASVKVVCTVFEIIHGQMVLKDLSALGQFIIQAPFSAKKTGASLSPLVLSPSVRKHGYAQ